MAKYVLGQGAARKLQEMMRGHMKSGRIDGDGARVVDECEYAHPFRLTYAADEGSVDEQTGEADGAWIIWLPDGCLVIDGEAVDLTSGMTAATNYPAGWYDLTDIFDGTDPDDFELYLDASKDDPKFVIDPDDAENPVLIAVVDDKMVKGVVESALVFSKGGDSAPFPWELRAFKPDDPEDPPEWRVWIPSAALTFIYGSLARDVVYDSGTGVYRYISPNIASAMWGSANYAGTVDSPRTAAAAEAGYSGLWATVSVAAAGGSVYLRVYVASTDTMPPTTIQLVNALPSGKDATVNHPVTLTADGWYIKIASVDSDGVITQCVKSMLTLSLFTDGVIQKMLVAGDGISITESGGRITISASGSSGGGGGSSGSVDAFVGYDGDLVLASLPTYDSVTHQLKYTPVTLTFDNGRLAGAVAASSPTVITTAVEET